MKPLRNREMNMNLIEAAKSGDLRQVKKLIKAGVNVNIKVRGNSALVWAALRNDELMTALLVAHGAEIYDGSETAMVEAIAKGFNTVAEYLESKEVQ